MLAEIAVYLAIKHLAPTYPLVAPAGAPSTRIVYQQVGGFVVNYQEDTSSDVDHGRIQVTCWSPEQPTSANLCESVSETLILAPNLQARPVGARVSVYENDTKLYGARQDFSVWSPK